MIDTDDIRYHYMAERYCDMTDSVALLIKNINDIKRKYIGKVNSKQTRYNLEEEIQIAIKEIQGKYPNVTDEMDDIRFIVIETSDNNIGLMPCNLFTSLIFNQLDTI